MKLSDQNLSQSACFFNQNVYGTILPLKGYKPCLVLGNSWPRHTPEPTLLVIEVPCDVVDCGFPSSGRCVTDSGIV